VAESIALNPPFSQREIEALALLLNVFYSIIITFCALICTSSGSVSAIARILRIVAALSLAFLSAFCLY